MKLAIVGSRSYNNYEEMKRCIEEALGSDRLSSLTTIVSGGAKGADTLAVRYAQENSLSLMEIFPDYAKYSGREAPLNRNTRIVEACDVLIAFPTDGSRGTWDSVTKARNSNKPYFVVIHGKVTQ